MKLTPAGWVDTRPVVSQEEAWRQFWTVMAPEVARVIVEKNQEEVASSGS